MKTALIENNPLLKLSIAFSLDIIEYCEKLNDHKKFIISKQLLRSATSIGANSMEAQNPESKLYSQNKNCCKGGWRNAILVNIM